MMSRQLLRERVAAELEEGIIRAILLAQKQATAPPDFSNSHAHYTLSVACIIMAVNTTSRVSSLCFLSLYKLANYTFTPPTTGAFLHFRLL